MSAKPDDPEEQLAEGTLMSHLLELRSRIMKALLAVIAVFFVLAYWMNDVFELVSKPLRDALPEGSEMIVTDVAAPFLTPMKTAFFVALFIAMPVVLFQIWQFIAPGLYKREKRLAIPLLISSIALFYAGIAFAYFIVFKVMFGFFARVVPGGVQMSPDISAYLSFVLGIFLTFGVAFEVPIATVLLIWSGLVSVKTLKNVRPYVFLGAFVAGMLLAPDVFSMTLMAIPIYALYEGGLLMARVLVPEKMGTETASAQKS
jgi:sec-independent protein translocase protein TatC